MLCLQFVKVCILCGLKEPTWNRLWLVEKPYTISWILKFQAHEKVLSHFDIYVSSFVASFHFIVSFVFSFSLNVSDSTEQFLSGFAKHFGFVYECSANRLWRFELKITSEMNDKSSILRSSFSLYRIRLINEWCKRNIKKSETSDK